VYAARKIVYSSLEQKYECRVISYVSGDRPGLETQMHPEVRDLFVQHLDAIGPTKRIGLVLYTCGGVTLAAWGIANLLHRFCDELLVIIPSKALSAGTLLSLAANRIIMTKQATLGPIDPSVNSALNPTVPNNPQLRVPVNVEEINGYIQFAESVAGQSPNALIAALNKLTDHVHPLVLGGAFRSRAQIRMLARKLLTRQELAKESMDRILDFLCSESGSHDYTIDRREARDELGLNIENPDDESYSWIKALMNDISSELMLRVPFSAKVEMAGQNPYNYIRKRGLVESIVGGCHCFISEGILTLQQVQNASNLPMEMLNDEKTFEGWRHEI
jgi:hypothetical protein